MNEVIILVVAFCIQAACIVVCGNIMRAKGRGLHFGQFIGFMLGIYGIPVCLVWPDKIQRKHKISGESYNTTKSQDNITRHPQPS